MRKKNLELLSESSFELIVPPDGSLSVARGPEGVTFDDVTRTLLESLARCRALNEGGITCYFDQILTVFLVIKHPKLTIDFIRQLEIKSVVSSPSTDTKQQQYSGTGGNWSSPLERSTFWNGQSVISQLMSGRSNGEDDVSDNMAVLEGMFLLHQDTAIIQLSALAPSISNISGSADLDHSSNLAYRHRFQLTVSVLWKPLSQSSPVVLSQNSASPALVSRPPTGSIGAELKNIKVPIEPSVTTGFPYSPTYAVPVRKTIRQAVDIQSAFTAELVASNLSNELQSQILLLLNLTNVSSQHLRIESLEIVARGFSVLSINADEVGSTDKTKPELNPDETIGFLYQLTFNDRVSEDGKTTYPTTINTTNAVHSDGHMQQFELNSTPNERIRDAQLFVSAAIGDFGPDGNLEGVSIRANWKIEIDQNGNLIPAPVYPPGYHENKQPVIGSPIYSRRTSASREGVAISFTPLSDARVHHIFTVRVLVSNLTESTRNLCLVFPHNTSFETDDTVQGDAGMINMYGLHSYMNCRVALDPVEFLDLYDRNQAQHSRMVCLENYVRVPNLAGQSSTAIHLHFLPVGGGGSLQSIDMVKCLDEDTGAVCDIPHVLEMLVKP